MQAADEVDAAVIALGSRERHGAAGLVVRSVSHDVAQRARRPLLIGTQQARRRVAQGRFSSATTAQNHARRAIEAAHALVSAREAVVLDAAGAQQGADFAQQLGFHAVSRTAAALTRQVVIDVAGEVDASLIVIGSRGLSGAREVVEHSVSHDIAAHAHRAVLVVPPYGAGGEGDTVTGSSKL